eukprot:g26444.t1
MQLPRPIFLVSTVVVICHPLWCFLLIHRWEKGAFGAGLTVTLSYGLNFLLLTSYVAIVRPGPCKEAWRILPLELLSQKCRRTGVSDCDNSSFAAYLRVALPSAVLMWAEWWAYEAMSLLAGLCGKTGLAAHTAACSVLLIVFQLPTGLGNATSAMVGHAIGAGSSTDAKSSLKVAVMLILSTCLLVAVILIPSRFFIARLYTSDPDVLNSVEPMSFPCLWPVRYGGRLLGGAETEGAELDSQRLTPVLFANCLVIGLSAALTGYDHGAASGALQNLVALKGLRRQRRFGPLLQGWVVASAWVSNIIGNLSGYYMPTPRIAPWHFVAVQALIVAGLLEMLGSLLTGFAPTLWVLILGRLVNGFGLGLNGVAVAQYVSEVAPPHARGGAIAVQETTFVSGAFIGALVGQHFLRIRHGWRTIWGLAAFFGGLATVTMLRMPDTPRSIYRRAARMAAAETSQTPEAAQRHLLQVLEEARREAMSTMCQLRGIEFPDQAMLSELEGIERTYVSELNLLGRAASSEGAQEWWQEELPLLEILRTLYCRRDAATAGVAMYALKLAIAAPSFLWLDAIGRRKLLSFGLTGVTACYGLSAVGLGLHSPGLAGAGLLASQDGIQAIYQSCVGPVTWIVSSELYPSDMRARGCALASATFSTSTLLSVQFHPLLISRGPFTVFATYAMTAQAAWLLTRAACAYPGTFVALGRHGRKRRSPCFDGFLPARSSTSLEDRCGLYSCCYVEALPVRGEDGLQVLLNRVKKNGPGELYAGAIATFAANWVGNYPYFVVFNALDQAWLAPSDPTMRIVRTGVMGLDTQHTQ